jgi:hypothetical protein
LRSAWSGIYVANGWYDAESGEHAFSDGSADAVAYGRLFLANPDLPTRLRHRLPSNVPDTASFYGDDERGYIVSGALGSHEPALMSGWVSHVHNQPVPMKDSATLDTLLADDAPRSQRQTVYCRSLDGDRTLCGVDRAQWNSTFSGCWRRR